MEYRLTFDIAEYGRDPANGERFLSGFIEAHPETGPAVMQNTETGILTVMFSFEADEFSEVGRRATEIFADGAIATGLPAEDVVSAHIDLIRDAEQDPAETASQSTRSSRCRTV